MRKYCTRNVEAFLKKTDIAYRSNQSEKDKFWWHAIAVFFKNASTLRVLSRKGEGESCGKVYWSA